MHTLLALGRLFEFRLSRGVRTVLVVVVALLGLSEGARAQPAGNAHPQTQMLSGQGLKNPFGEAAGLEASGAATMTPEQKWAFSKEVDLSPLRDLALYHNGRLKILDTLARESVANIAGRKNYYDVRPPERGKGQGKDYVPSASAVYQGAGTRLSYDPLFTYLDLIIDPAYYQNKALIGVGYLPLRDQILLAVFPGDDKADLRDAWKKSGRVSPPMAAGTVQTIASSGTLDAAMQAGINDVHNALELYLGSAGNLMMVPAARDDEPWAHLSSLSEAHPAARAARDLGAAWRAGDAAKVNAAAKALAEALPAISPQVYPTTRRTLEALYNRSSPFEWGMWLYAFALVSLLLALGTRRATLKWMGLAFLLGAVVMHAGGFAARCYIAERFAIQNQFESMTGVSLLAAIVGLALAALKRQWLFGAATAAVGFMILITATQTGIPGKDISREAAILNTSVLLKYHVTTVLFSYGLISLGMVVSLFYLVTHYFGRGRGAAAAVTVASEAVGSDNRFVRAAQAEEAAPVLGQGLVKGAARAVLLHDLDRAQMTILQLAFWTLGVGILLGAWWADHSWGRWWAFDPKELWALVTWIIYLIVVHVRVASVGNKPLITAWLSVVGFVVMLWCYFGVNLLLPGLHAYA